MGLNIGKVTIPAPLPRNFDAPAGSLQGRSVWQQMAPSHGLCAKIQEIFTRFRATLAHLLEKALRPLRYTTRQEGVSGEATALLNARERTSRVAAHYLRTGAQQRYNAPEAAGAYFEDCTGLERGALLSQIHALSGALANETGNLGRLKSPGIEAYSRFASQMTDRSRNGAGSLTAALEYFQANQRELPTLRQAAPKPLQMLYGEIRAKADALSRLLTTLDKMSNGGPRTMAEQAKKKPNLTDLNKAFNSAKALSSYVDRSAALNALIQAEESAPSATHATTRRSDLPPSQPQSYALGRIPKAQFEAPPRAHRSTSPSSGMTIRGCIAAGLDPEETLGSHEYDRQLAAVRARRSTTPELDFNARRDG